MRYAPAAAAISLLVAVSASVGSAQVEQTLRMRRPGPYQVPAAIAALHSQAPSQDETDWRQIEALYATLMLLQPSPVVELNRAVAVAMAEGPAPRLEIMERPKVAAALQDYRWFHSAKADPPPRVNLV